MLDSIDGGTPKRMVTMEFLHHLSSPQEPEVVPRRRRVVDVDVDDWRAEPVSKRISQFTKVRVFCVVENTWVNKSTSKRLVEKANKLLRSCIIV